jgi:hypothetical protein
MNWDAISAVAEVVGAVAVLITLVYLTIQVRVGNKQRELEALRHNWDGINRFCELLSESTEKASIVLRGRDSLENLTPEEYLVFEFLHIRILNTIELWYMQLMETSSPGEYRDQQIENLEGVIAYLFNYQGALGIWEAARHTFVPIQDLFDTAISGAQCS